MPETPGHSVPINRTTNGFGDDQSDQRCCVHILNSVPANVHNNARLRRPDAASYSEAEFRRPSHPVLGRQHCASPGFQAVKEPRPLRRRAVTIARPARVRMRSRKPWTLARRRLFGWNVRLPLATAFSPHHGWQFGPDSAAAHSRVTELPLSQALLEPARAHKAGRCRAAEGWWPLEGTEVTSAGQTTAPGSSGSRFAHLIFTGWHPQRNLLTSGWTGASKVVIW